VQVASLYLEETEMEITLTDRSGLHMECPIYMYDEDGDDPEQDEEIPL
jgi:hypothetical protein